MNYCLLGVADSVQRRDQNSTQVHNNHKKEGGTGGEELELKCSLIPEQRLAPGQIPISYADYKMRRFIRYNTTCDTYLLSYLFGKINGANTSRKLKTCITEHYSTTKSHEQSFLTAIAP
ncbi:hypothetical protein Y1Q_0010390 [Alligator mississippiensis]|uniref:Uncharacterized protein n=1 Tax=Alligator mississippiensis TaxID=8496 RepID=A0A151MPE8_ALLMI|nr:hypothetical protein Y1Q_0010390 [Alligator mississippiensis]